MKKKIYKRLNFIGCKALKERLLTKSIRLPGFDGVDRG